MTGGQVQAATQLGTNLQGAPPGPMAQQPAPPPQATPQTQAQGQIQQPPGQAQTQGTSGSAVSEQAENERRANLVSGLGRMQTLM